MSKTIALAQPFTIIRMPNIGIVSFSKFILSMLILLLFSLLAISVWQINSYSRDVFLLQNASHKLNAVAKENKILEINFNKSNSLVNFSASVGDQAFEKATNVAYLQVLDKKVVSRAR